MPTQAPKAAGFQAAATRRPAEISTATPTKSNGEIRKPALALSSSLLEGLGAGAVDDVEHAFGVVGDRVMQGFVRRQFQPLSLSISGGRGFGSPADNASGRAIICE